MAVVFPAPFGPTKPTISPCGTVNETQSRARTSPNRRERSSSSSTGYRMRNLVGVTRTATE